MVAGDDNDNDDDEIVFILLINQHIYSVNEEMLLRERESERNFFFCSHLHEIKTFIYSVVLSSHDHVTSARVRQLV